jgi:twitching motility two-component system response regulator PilG
LEASRGPPLSSSITRNLIVSRDDALMLLQEGIAMAKAGDKAQAYPLILEAMELNPENEIGWLWLAGLTKAPREAATYLGRALEINPNNERARVALDLIQARIQEAQPIHELEVEETSECPFCQTFVPEKVGKCPTCRAILVLTDIDALLGNADVDQIEVREAVERYRDVSMDSADFSTHYNLGLAHLNLCQIDEGIDHLQTAMRLRPDDEALQVQVEVLLQHRALAESPSDEEEARGTIMIVDDSPTVCKLVEITLERRGYQVIAAANGLEAMARMNDELPDMIFLDITMPRMDGYQLCKTIKGNDETEHIPVVMLSGKDGFIDKVRGRMVGALDYITKPFQPDELLSVVKKCVNRTGDLGGWDRS